MSNSVYNEPHIIWVAIITLFRFAQKYAAALKAYGNVYKDDGAQNAYIDVAQEALWRQLMSELSKSMTANRLADQIIAASGNCVNVALITPLPCTAKVVN